MILHLLDMTTHTIGRFKTKDFANTNWKLCDDSVYNRLYYHINDENKERLYDFLNMYYYFMSCYSRTCFKKRNDYRKLNFNYQLANDLEAQTALLTIQRTMHEYRGLYAETIEQLKPFWNNAIIAEIMEFINDSLRTMANIISQPVSYIIIEIRQLINKYKTIPDKIKSKKINYDVYSTLNLSLDESSPNMITISFKGGNT